ASQDSGERSEAAVHKTTDRASDAVSAVRAGVGVVVELRRRARRIGSGVHSSTSHPPNAIAGVAGDGARRDLGLGVSVHEDAMAGIVLDSVREDLRGGPPVHLNSLRSIVLNGVGGAHPVVRGT